jgi:2-amino-4-hydroxy-6-hydroxymethyldihydropteridine diphosphokinase
MAEVYIGLGSNIDPERNITRACVELERHFGPLRSSSVYRSAAVGFVGDDFLNMVVSFDATADPDAVERVLTALEQAAGRRRQAASGPRTLDLDLLIYGQMVDATRRLPRADVLGYAFVLGPLAELAPDLRHPVSGARIGEIWRRRDPGDGSGLINLGPVGALTSRRFGPRPPQ